jgi:hypothetical protein
MPTATKGDYQVGYGRPPRNAGFKKGQSRLVQRVVQQRRQVLRTRRPAARVASRVVSKLSSERVTGASRNAKRLAAAHRDLPGAVAKMGETEQTLTSNRAIDYMREGPFAALDAIEQATGEREANVIGYCLGGTLLASTLAYMAVKRDSRAPPIS